METLTDEQIDFLNRYCKGKWEQTDKVICVNGYVDICDLGLKKIPVKFYKVKGYFDCYYNNLTSLENCPEYVEGDFACSYNNLKSLEGIEEVKGRIHCSNNKINYKREKELRPEIYKRIYISTLEKFLLTNHK